MTYGIYRHISKNFTEKNYFANLNIKKNLNLRKNYFKYDISF